MAPSLPQPHAIGWKNHLIQAGGQGFGITGQHQHVGSLLIQSQFEQGSQPSGGGEPAALHQIARRRLTQVGGALSLQKIAGSGPVQPEQGKCCLPVPGRCHAWSVAAQAEISDRRNRLISSRPAASMAAAPPSSRSTIVTTRFT